MFEWQVALGLELLVILVGFLVFLKADDESRPRTFVKIVAIVVILFSTLLAACTVTKAVLYALRDEGDAEEVSTAIQDKQPKPVRPVSSPGVGTGKTPKEPLPEWKGDLQKKKWHERGEMMKRKWAERGA